MAKIVVSDTSPLIALARIDQLTIITKLFEKVVIPAAVAKECLFDTNLPGAANIKKAVNAEYVEIAEVKNKAVHKDLLNILDEGEAEAIALSIDLKAPVLLDEKQGRQIAKKKNVPVIGTGGLLIAAKKAKLVTAVHPILKQLKQNGYYLSDQLVLSILSRVQEG